MKNFIEELYYGNLDPQMQCGKSSTFQNALHAMVAEEDYLTEALTDENKSHFLNFVDSQGEAMGESNLDNFVTGFRCGAAFSMAVFTEDDENSPLWNQRIFYKITRK